MKNKYTQLGQYKVLRMIGEGSTSKLKLVIHQKTYNYYALKIFKPKRLAKDQTLLKELKVIQRFHHPNIVKAYSLEVGATQTKPSGKKSQQTFMVLELIRGGELFDYVSKTKLFTDPICRHFFRQMISGIGAVHEAGYCHGDLKPGNILFDADFNLKLTDFGFSRPLVDEDGYNMLTNVWGTKGYMAPEIYERRPYDGTKSDIFAAGVTLFEMKTQQRPFQCASKDCSLYRIFSQNKERFWSKMNRKIRQILKSKTASLDPDFIDLINGMLHHDPDQRLTLKQIRNHPYFKGPTPAVHEVQRDFSDRYLQIQSMKRPQVVPPKNSPTLKETVQESPLLNQTAGLKDVNLIKGDIQQLFEHLVTCLHHFVLKGNERVLIDNEHYTIQIESRSESLQINLYSVDETHCAIEFQCSTHEDLDKCFSEQQKGLIRQYLRRGGDESGGQMDIQSGGGDSKDLYGPDFY